MAFVGLNRRMSSLLRVAVLAIFVIISLRLVFCTEQPWTEISSWKENREDGGAKSAASGHDNKHKSTGDDDNDNDDDDDAKRRPDPDHASSDPEVSRLIRAALRPLDAEATRGVDMLECPVWSTALARYDYLRVPIDPDHLGYAFTIDLRGRALDVLPTLLASTIQAMRFLDAGRCALSFIVGDEMRDRTPDVLKAIRQLVEDHVGSRYKFQRSSSSGSSSEAGLPAKADGRGRAGAGAGAYTPPVTRMKTLALLPLVGEKADWGVGPNTTLVFMNDVAICLEDILELVHQMRWLKADMTCAMDWTATNDPATNDQTVSFLDVWSSRTMSGNTFMDLPEHGGWGDASEMLPHDRLARARLSKHQPFQVFSCWSGAVSMLADSLMPMAAGDARGPWGRAYEGITFRDAERGARGGGNPGSEADNCFAGAGEPQRLAKDLWNNGFGRVAAVPAVSVGHGTVDQGRAVKRARGFASAWAAAEAVARKAELAAATEDGRAAEARRLAEEERWTDDERKEAREKAAEEDRRERKEAGQEWLWGEDTTAIDEDLAKIRAERKLMALEDRSDYKIRWVDEPPKKVKCTTKGREKSWEPWNEVMGSL